MITKLHPVGYRQTASYRRQMGTSHPTSVHMGAPFGSETGKSNHRISAGVKFKLMSNHNKENHPWIVNISKRCGY